MWLQIQQLKRNAVMRKIILPQQIKVVKRDTKTVTIIPSQISEIVHIDKRLARELH